jgi:hypothetical protein
MIRLSAVLLLAVSGMGRAAASREDLASIRDSSLRASRSASLDDSAALSGGGFDSIRAAPLVESLPPAPGLQKSRLGYPTADVIRGNSGRDVISEPKSLLGPDGVKDERSGNRLWWALGGAVALGAGGFFLGGPIGAAAGAAAGALLGWLFGP